MPQGILNPRFSESHVPHIRTYHTASLQAVLCNFILPLSFVPDSSRSHLQLSNQCRPYDEWLFSTTRVCTRFKPRGHMSGKSRGVIWLLIYNIRCCKSIWGTDRCSSRKYLRIVLSYNVFYCVYEWNLSLFKYVKYIKIFWILYKFEIKLFKNESFIRVKNNSFLIC